MRFQAIGHVSHSTRQNRLTSYKWRPTSLIPIISSSDLSTCLQLQLGRARTLRAGPTCGNCPITLGKCASQRALSLTHSLAASFKRIPEFSRIGSTRKSFTLRDQRAAARAWQINSIQVVHTKTLPSPHSCAPPPSALSTQTNGNRSSNKSQKCRSYFVHSAPYRTQTVLP